jgi:hypothetical protein
MAQQKRREIHRVPGAEAREHLGRWAHTHLPPRDNEAWTNSAISEPCRRRRESLHRVSMRESSQPQRKERRQATMRQTCVFALPGV